MDLDSTRDLDLIVYGATGFTGRQCARYLMAHGPDGLRWAIAGRNVTKLRAVQTELGGASSGPAMIIADAHDAVAISHLVKRTKVVLTTAGPYAKYGSPLFAACAAAGTDYVDITGETPWVRQMLDQHESVAKASGARLVPFCGFDSIPSELGVWLLVRHFRDVHNEGTREVRSAFRAKGGVNGGTLDSALHMFETGDARRLAKPFLLNPPDARPGKAPERSHDPQEAVHDADLDCWTAPFFMGPVNTRVVRRSDALWTARGEGYGDDFAYRETMRVPNRLMGAVIAAGMGMFMVLGSRPWGRSLVRSVVPAPGEGPSEATMDNGHFDVSFIGVSDTGRKAVVRITSQGDPGNRSTVRMLCEAALCFVVDPDTIPASAHGGGILTPTTAFGSTLVDRLKATGEMTFTVEAR